MKTAIVGASGLVGRTMLDLLADCDWVDEEPLLLGSPRSAGLELSFRGRPVACQAVGEADLSAVRLALFSAGAAASREVAPAMVAAGSWVVDNSSAWRMDPAVPLVVPEVNAQALPGSELLGSTGGLIANPNCSTIQIAMALAPLEEAFGLREAHVTTLQAVSGAGQAGVAELQSQLAEATEPAAFPRPIAFNAIPQIGPLHDDGSCEEELKVLRELRKIHGLPHLQVTCTVTRVPVWTGHAAACRVLLGRDVTAEDAAAVMSRWPGLEVASAAADYRTPREIAGSRTTHVGRLRQDPGRSDGLLFWVVADNLLKGAAWNAVQIAAALVDRSEGAWQGPVGGLSVVMPATAFGDAPLRPTLVTQLGPAARLAALALSMATCFTLPPVGLAIWLLLQILLLLQGGLSQRHLWALARPWGVLVLFVLLIHTLTTESAAPLGRPSLAGFLAGVVALARLAATVASLVVFIRGTTLSDLTAGLTWWLQPLRPLGADPARLGLVLAVALGMAPRVLAEGQRLDAVTRLRRARLGPWTGQGNRLQAWWQRTLDRGYLLVPLVEGLFRRSEGLSLSLEHRMPRRTDAALVRPHLLELAILTLWLAMLVSLWVD